MGNVVEGMKNMFTALGEFLQELIKDLQAGSILLGQLIKFVAKLITFFGVVIDFLLDILSHPEFYMDLAELLLLFGTFTFITTQFLNMLDKV